MLDDTFLVKISSKMIIFNILILNSRSFVFICSRFMFFLTIFDEKDVVWKPLNDTFRWKRSIKLTKWVYRRFSHRCHFNRHIRMYKCLVDVIQNGQMGDFVRVATSMRNDTRGFLDWVKRGHAVEVVSTSTALTDVRCRPISFRQHDHMCQIEVREWDVVVDLKYYILHIKAYL